MIRRYDMTRSDNAPVNSRCMMPVSKGSGHFWVHTSMNVRAVTISPVSIPEGSMLEVDHSSIGGKGFRVFYSNIPDDGMFVEFSFVMQ